MSTEIRGLNPEEHSAGVELRNLTETIEEMLRVATHEGDPKLIGKLIQTIKASPDMAKEITRVDALIVSTDGEPESVRAVLGDYLKPHSTPNEEADPEDDKDSVKSGNSSGDEWNMGSDEAL